MASGGGLAAAFSQFASKGDKATSKDITRWFQDAKCFGKNCTSNHLDICFSKAKTKGQTTINLKEMEALIGFMAKSYGDDKKIPEGEAKTKLTEELAGASKKGHGTTGTSKTGNVGKMTDSSQYTGSHKERFDASGKGKGIAGREEVAENTGYVGNYKGDGTYDKKK